MSSAPLEKPDVESVRSLALNIYDSACTDVITQPAAFGLAVGYLHNQLEVPLRVAAQLLDEMIQHRS